MDRDGIEWDILQAENVRYPIGDREDREDLKHEGRTKVNVFIRHMLKA